MIELKTLGALDIECPDGGRAAEICARPKPLALLVYLAIAKPRGFHSQDALLALFWPESDTARAQQSLRQSVHLLRQALGNDAVLRRGRAELSVNEAIVGCDAIRFEEAYLASNFEAALELYRGELLPAFYAPDAPDFERWLSSERGRLRDLAIRCARARVSECEASARYDAAVIWANRLLSFFPHDEAPADVVALAARLKELEHHESRILDATANPRRSQNSVDDIPAPAPDKPAAQRRVPLWQRHSVRIVALAAAIVLLAVGIRGPIANAFRAQRSSTSSLDTRIAVLPFTVRGGENVSYLHEGMVDLLSAKLDGAGGLSTVDARAVVTVTRDRHMTDIDPLHALTIAREFGAGQFILGSVIDVGGHIAITASVYDANGRVRATVEGTTPDESHLLPVVDSMARELLAAQFAKLPERLEHVAATTTSSLPALKSFLDGERAVRAGQLTSAVDAFNKAVHEDSTFALAHYRLSTTASWSTQQSLVQHSVDEAVRYANRLPQHERLALEARNLVRNGQAEEGDRLYRNIVVTYPYDTDAWNQLGELLFHTGPWRGHPMADARNAFEHVLALEPTDANALLHLARLAALERRENDVIALVARAMALRPEPATALELTGLRIAATHNDGARLHLLDSLRTNTDAQGVDDALRLTAWRVATYCDDPLQGSAIVTTLANANSNSELQSLAHSTLAHMNGALGHWQAARQELAWLDRNDPELAPEVRANLALTFPSMFSSRERVQTVQRLRETSVLDSPRAADRILRKRTATDVAREDAVRARQSRRAYLAGALAVQEGDSTTAHSQGAILNSIAEHSSAASELARHFQHQLVARQFWKRGNAIEALREVEAGWPGGGPRASLPLYQGDAYTQAHERYFRAELLAALHRDTEAARWYEAVVDDQGSSITLSAPVHLALARIAERKGDGATAIAQYTRATQLWSSADPDARGEQRDVPRKLAQLRANASAPHADVIADDDVPVGGREPPQ